MSVYSDLFVYFDTQWSDRTKLVFPGNLSNKHSGSFTDATTTIQVFVLDVGSSTLSIPVLPSSIEEKFFILQCNIVGMKDKGYGTVYGHVEQLDSIFKNQTFTQGSYQYNFEESRMRPQIPDDQSFVVPWECSFFVYLNN